MFDSAILDTVIGVVFLLVLFSTVCAALRESIESILKTRASYLEYGIRELLNDMSDEGLVRELYTHPLVSGLFADQYKPTAARSRTVCDWKRRNLPSYIPAKNFAAALIDIAMRGKHMKPVPADDTSAEVDALTGTQTGQIKFEEIRKSVSRIENKNVERVVLSALDRAEGDINKAVANLEAWFDSGMDRVSGWYKRLSSRIILAIAFVLAVLLNVDLIHVSRELYRNQEQRAVLVAYAQGTATEPVFVENRKAAFELLKNQTFPVGWGGKTLEQAWTATSWEKLFGWVFTAFAAILGAPFWFDVLNKFMVIRATVKPHEKSKEERSQDN